MDAEERLRRLKLWAAGKPQGPTSIHIDPTNRCNLRCIFCWQRPMERKGWLDRKSELPPERLMALVREAADLGVTDWLISGGGEPLCRPKATVDIMCEIKRLGMYGDIITNGTILTEWMMRRIVGCGYDELRVSIGDPDARTDDALRGMRGAHRRSVKALARLREIKKESGKELPRVGFNTVINRLNFRHLSELFRLAHELGCEMINFQTIILYDRLEAKWTLTRKMKVEFPRYAKEALDVASGLGIRTNLKSYLDEELVDKSTSYQMMHKAIESDASTAKAGTFEGAYCFEPFYLITIRANGIAGSCRLFGDSGTSLHDQTLHQVWFGPYFESARRRQIDRQLPEFCSRCGSNEFAENQRLRREILAQG